VKQLADGGYIIAGHTASSGSGLMDFYLIRINSGGDTVWTKTYGGTGQDYGYAVDTTSDGGFIIAGDTQSFGTSQGGIFLVKTNQLGDTIWTAIYDAFNIDVCRDVKPTMDGGYILAGWTRSFGAGEYDMYLIKTNSSGDTLWTKTYGDFLDEECYSVQPMSDGGFVICGYQEPNHHSRILIVRTDNAGNKLWERTIGQTGGQSARSITQTSDGGFVMTGWIDTSSVTRQDLFLIKLEPEVTPIFEDNRVLFPSSHYLSQNYPNPFNPSTSISWQVPGPAQGSDWQLAVGNSVKLTVYNLVGEKITVLVDEKKTAGYHSIEWNASTMPSGIYFYRLVVGDYAETRKMVLMK
jgi:hypothetical protein